MSGLLFNSDEVAWIASDYVTRVFDESDQTHALGFLSDTGNDLTQTIEDPETIRLVALRMLEIADEIESRCTHPAGRRAPDDPTLN